MILNSLSGLQYVVMLMFIMMIAGIVKEKELFAPLFGALLRTFKNNRVVLVLVSAVGGVLPIEGRVTVSAGILDSMCKDGSHSGRQKMGVVDYLSTHHYYIWSPLEKSVILPLAAFGLTYAQWMTIMWPLLAVALIFLLGYVYFNVKETDINIAIPEGKFSWEDFVFHVVPFLLAIAVYAVYGNANNVIIIFGALLGWYVFVSDSTDIKRLWSYVKPSVLLTIAAIIVVANVIKTQDGYFAYMATRLGENILLLSLINFGASFLMGSSSKYAALAVLSTQLAGIEYLVWFFVIDYIGYLLSPTHKCLAIGCQYFKTPITYYYKVLGAWVAVLFATAVIMILI